ncbi:4,5-dioxygenase [Vibrio sp. RE86]|uniref:DOPA 4,5-dioxygenase family protein n=1 Tax=Vibrio sp. RE86 TaxID=2607605 RepID=UPI001493630F|nr:DOPA 4,5-dioxygenase family protein [Vibrio sp. RE86]NOH80125.1 4,5-dioxygenase [Vibrio sp. RE86]
MSFPKNIHQDYHAHIYFNQNTSASAKALRENVQETFSLPVGNFNEKPVGPHTMWSFSITFTANDFDALIAWLEENRGSFSVLVHALTGDDHKDHTDYAYWLGESVELDLSRF